MVLSEKILSKLVCPQCKGSLDFREDDQRLDCNNCNVSYCVENDIPVLLIDEARKLKLRSE